MASPDHRCRNSSSRPGLKRFGRFGAIALLAWALLPGSTAADAPAQACPGVDSIDAPRPAIAEPGAPAALEGTSDDRFGSAHLQAELERLRRLLRQGTARPELRDGKLLRPGDLDPQVLVLRRRLAQEALPLPPAETNPARLDAALAATLREVQRRYGLADDGILGPRSRSALNRSLAARIAQIEVNLERWRALDLDPRSRHVLVNIAGFRLDRVERGNSVGAMRVIVGTPEHPTPQLSARLRYLVFNPWWEIPTELGRRSVVPAQLRDPGHFERAGIEILTGPEAVAVPIAEADLAAHQRGEREYRLRQKPGPLNPLGRIKFIFPNEHSVYLHDTPDRALFARAVRDFSSGCIRVQQPQRLAAWLLQAQGMEAAEVSDAFEHASNRTVPIETPVMVHLGYWTAWVEAGGRVVLADDIYGLDPGAP